MRNLEPEGKGEEVTVWVQDDHMYNSMALHLMLIKAILANYVTLSHVTFGL